MRETLEGDKMDSSFGPRDAFAFLAKRKSWAFK
jgi:hypothetical protein